MKRSTSILTILLVMALIACSSGEAASPNAKLAEEAELTESWGCGIGFAASNEDQTVALFVYSNDQEPRPPVTFPSDAWDARLVVGRDLMANHCDDVIEPGEPEPVIDEEWTLSGGSLDFVDPDAGMCGAPEPVVGTFTAITAQNDNGTLTLGDLEVVNDSYGCFAG